MDVTHELEGWKLLWADLEWSGSSDGLGPLRERTGASARQRWTLGELSQDPVVSALRRLFRQAGTDPTRYRPSSEALLRRVLKGEPLPEIHPLVDLNNCLSAEMAVPVCVMDQRFASAPFTLRAGRAGEEYESLRGPFALEGRPLLTDAEGPADTPISGNTRVKVRDDSSRVWLVAYLPAETEAPARAEEAFRRILSEAPIATLHQLSLTG